MQEHNVEIEADLIQPHFPQVWLQKYNMAASENQVNEGRDTKLLFYINGSALQQHVVHSLQSLILHHLIVEIH